MMIDIGPKFYLAPSPPLVMTYRSRSRKFYYKVFTLKVGACSANFIPILLKYFLNYQSQFLTTKRISFTTKRSKEN